MNESRSLCHIEEVLSIEPIPEADRIELVRVLGWNIVCGKGEFEVGEKVVYIEIDSILNTAFKPFSFLTKDVDKYGFVHIKTRKLRGVYSQGLCIKIPEKYKHLKNGSDLTSIFNKGTYGLNSNIIHNEGYADIKELYGKDNNKKHCKFVRFLKRIWVKLFPRKKKGSKENIPSPYSLGIAKTDEERIQNMRNLFEQFKRDRTVLIATEKVDGSSSTYHADTSGGIYIASRNVSLCYKSLKGVEKTSSSYNNSLWQKVCDKYRLEQVLQRIKPQDGNVTIQGEILGSNVQNNLYKLEPGKYYLKVFNIIINGRILSFSEMEEVCKNTGLETVPFLGKFIIPKEMTLEEFIELSDGRSQLNRESMREGIVYRTEDYKTSFKVVSNKYLCAKGE